jgi:hypothetical protein
MFITHSFIQQGFDKLSLTALFSCHPEPVKGLLGFEEGLADFANCLISSQSSLNKACFFFLDHHFNCFSHFIASSTC